MPPSAAELTALGKAHKEAIGVLRCASLPPVALRRSEETKLRVRIRSLLTSCLAVDNLGFVWMQRQTGTVVAGRLSAASMGCASAARSLRTTRHWRCALGIVWTSASSRHRRGAQRQKTTAHACGTWPRRPRPTLSRLCHSPRFSTSFSTTSPPPPPQEATDGRQRAPPAHPPDLREKAVPPPGPASAFIVPTTSDTAPSGDDHHQAHTIHLQTARLTSMSGDTSDVA